MLSAAWNWSWICCRKRILCRGRQASIWRS